MGKALVIAEKPSVANDISKALGKFEKKKDYFLFDKFLDSFYKVDINDIKVIEDYSDLDASTVADDIAERSEDTPTLFPSAQLPQ